MRPAARLAAAIEVLEEVLARHRPVAAALADWGKAHRFAGSGDRAAIGNLVYDAIRWRLSTAARMGADSPRALALGAAAAAWNMPAATIAAFCDGSQHAPSALSETERAGLERSVPEDAPDHVKADVPAWLWPLWQSQFKAAAIAQGRALAARAPVDLRANPLKASRERVLKALPPQIGAVPTPISPLGIRIAPPVGTARTPNVQAEGAFQRGWFEVQDEGSQVAALIAAAAAGGSGQVLDLCAGAGGKTLAIAAAFRNRGQIFATDADTVRLAPIYERVKRAGAHNVQMRPPRPGALDDLAGKMDCVVVDAPCTGTGIWRRRPESKWRLTSAQLAKRIDEQRAILSEALGYLKPGGRLVYITCSLLSTENAEQVAWLLGRRPGLAPVPMPPLADAALGAVPEDAIDSNGTSLTLTPFRHGTDGFFVAVVVAA
jgi:16S rRNA (cytosine967-C5)-methyltransferase